jgi:hypothetical protein
VLDQPHQQVRFIGEPKIALDSDAVEGLAKWRGFAIEVGREEVQVARSMPLALDNLTKAALRSSSIGPSVATTSQKTMRSGSPTSARIRSGNSVAASKRKPTDSANSTKCGCVLTSLALTHNTTGLSIQRGANSSISALTISDDGPAASRKRLRSGISTMTSLLRAIAPRALSTMRASASGAKCFSRHCKAAASKVEPSSAGSNSAAKASLRL